MLQMTKRRKNPIIISDLESPASQLEIPKWNIDDDLLSAGDFNDFSMTTGRKKPTSRATKSKKTVKVIASQIKLSPLQTKGSPIDAVYSADITPWQKLTIHKKKLEEVEDWLLKFKERSELGRNVLIVSGPTGSGKTTVVKSLMAKHSIECIDGYDFVAKSQHPSKEEGFEGDEEGAGQIEDRKRLINAAFQSSFPSLKLVEFCHNEGDGLGQVGGGHDARSRLNSRHKLILLDDVPSLDASFCLKELYQMMMMTMDAGKQQSPNLIVIVTDPCCHQSWSDDSLLRKIATLSGVSHIQFNPVAPTLIKKLLKDRGISQSQTLKLDAGDAHAALIDAFFSLEHSGRDESFTIFHTVGKILYPRTTGKNPIDPSALTAINRPLIHSFLHENYPKFISDPKMMSLVADSLSWIDSAPWTAIKDQHWNDNYTSLPETLIHWAVNSHPSVVKPTFQSIKAPSRSWSQNNPN